MRPQVHIQSCPPPLQPPLNWRTVACRDERRRNLQGSQNPILARIPNIGERCRTVAKQRRGGFPSRGSRVQIPSPAPPILRAIKAICTSPDQPIFRETGYHRLTTASRVASGPETT